MLRYLRRRATIRGPFGGSRQWTLVWAILMGVRLLRRLTKSKEDVVYSEELRPGESLLISGVDREPRIIGAR
jgi:hypothetical protein